MAGSKPDYTVKMGTKGGEYYKVAAVWKDLNRVSFALEQDFLKVLTQLKAGEDVRGTIWFNDTNAAPRKVSDFKAPSFEGTNDLPF